jgi:chaperonin GroEL
LETIKTKSASKIVVPRSDRLERDVLDTMAIASTVVGGTLGPGGHPVLIERPEYNLPPYVTKDGVTVFKAIGLPDPVEQCILEAARDASVRTAQEAGDGTTTATILSEAFVRYTTAFCKKNPNIPPICVIRTIQKLYDTIIEPEIKKLTIECDLSTQEGKHLLRNVAKISANGDLELADAVMECFDITGDAGNVTIVESTGPTHYEVERTHGYSISSGFEESCAKYYPAFINDPSTQRVVLEKPGFILYFGRLNDIQSCLDLLNRLQQGFEGNYLDMHNFVLMATGFSESVLANLASIFAQPNNINIFPLVIPKTAVLNSERHFLDDVAAVTGAVVFDPLTKPMNEADFEDIGNMVAVEENCNGIPQKVYRSLGVSSFECGRYRSTILGRCDEEILTKRIEELEAAVSSAESEYDLRQLQERLAKLSGGIAKLKVIGSSNGEMKERRDRAEDAVCAVRGAVKHGALVGGCWTLVEIARKLQEESDELVKEIVDSIVNPSLLSPLGVLFGNAGLDSGQQDKKVSDSLLAGVPEEAYVTDVSTGKVVKALDEGILDSVPAVRDAIKNAISIATLLGTLGGCVVFPRDRDFEIKEARDAADYDRVLRMELHNERV